MNPREASVAVITDGESLCDVLMRHAKAVFGEHNVRGFLYSESDVYLPRLMEECDCFVLELFRNYPGGLRAEGVALGSNLAQRGKRVIIFSPLSLEGKISMPCYWDTADFRAPHKALNDLHYGDLASPEEWRLLRGVFEKLLPVPPQHEG
jgi:hypothetical protein